VDDVVTNEFQFAGQDVPWLLSMWAQTKPDHPVLIWEPRSGHTSTWTYREFFDQVRALATGLAGRGVVQGDRVLIHSDNCPEMVLSWYACATLGAVAVTTNTRSVGAEISYFAEKAHCVVAITQPQYAKLVAASAPDLRWIAVTETNGGEAPGADEALDGSLPFAELFGDLADFRPRRPDPMRPVGIVFTSGTTSRPKAVVHTHANVLWGARIGGPNIGLTGVDTYLIYLPFFHVNAQSWSMWSVLGVGGTVVLQPKFSASRFWEVVVRHQVTHFSVIPFVFKAIAGQPVPEHHLKVGVFGAIVTPLESVLGCRIMPAFGMTETVTHATRADLWQTYPEGSMGKPTPGYECAIVDDDGELCPAGEIGELWFRGTRGIQLFLEYLDDPEANAKAFTADGWFKTGDRVRWGEGGNIFYCERDKDVLKVSGENVSAREVEDVCRQVPGVAEVAVVARGDDMLGEVAVAFVIAANTTEGEQEAIRTKILELCGANLADFKVPRAVYFVDDFPRATLDKVAKNRLRELADAIQDGSGMMAT
jgi:crotonobetaine/carnitine-CoA ligase